MQTGNADNFLSFDFGVKEFGIEDMEERIRLYREYVYEKGALTESKGAAIEESTLNKERAKKFKITPQDRFLKRTRYFTDSGIIGSREFVLKNFKRFKKLLKINNDRKPKKIAGLNGLYSMKRLNE